MSEDFKEYCVKDVPEEEKDNTVKNFKSAGCKVKVEKQTDGRFTIWAKCPSKKNT